MQKESLSQFFERCRDFYPHGALGKKCLRVVIDGQKFGLSIHHGYRGKDFTDFSLFPIDCRYARKTLVLSACGCIEEDNDGVIPSFDAIIPEPVFSSTNEVIFESIACQIDAKISRRLRERRKRFV